MFNQIKEKIAEIIKESVEIITFDPLFIFKLYLNARLNKSVI